jgi:radical SAM protein (TIGR01212 family)
VGRRVGIAEQIEIGIRQLRRQYGGKAEKFIAYFQPSTNTYAAADRLEQIYRTALEQPEIAGLAIGTRPDALPDDVLDVLESLSKTAWIQLEIGLQSIHQKSLIFLNRGHDYSAFLDAFQRARQRNLRLGVHLILGIPGEDQSDILAAAQEMSRLQPDCVKLHNLYVVRNTRLAELWQTGNLCLPTLEEYAGMVVNFLEILPPNIVIERISGEADTDFLLAPAWTGTKHTARNAIDQEFRHRNSFQGILAR